jgi:hypothetical protein
MTDAQKIAEEALAELERAEAKFAPFNSAHEGYAVMLEEVEELWDVIKLNPKKMSWEDIQKSGYGVAALRHRETKRPDPVLADDSQRAWMRDEAIQVAAMAIRFVKCLDDQWGKPDGGPEE